MDEKARVQRVVGQFAAIAVAAAILESARELLDGPFRDGSPMVRATVFYPMAFVAGAALQTAGVCVQKGVSDAEAEDGAELP